MTERETTPSDERLQTLVNRLLERDADAHADAVEALGDVGDQRVVPHLFEVLVIDAIANDWAEFGFPAALRERDPPRYLDLPEVRWPGVRDALAALTDPDFDSDHAWVEWESWYSQQDIDPLVGFEDWKLRLYRSYLPPVGGLLDCGPRDFDVQDIRWGNCDRSFLAALNAPDFVPGEAVDATGSGGDQDRYLEAEDTVFGFELDGTAYAVPRWVLFPHELLNATLSGVPVSLTYCTLCNAPILYDRRIGEETLTFGSSGMLLSGNKVMYDEETETLWDQHSGTPIGGHYLERDSGLFLDQFAVTQTTWADWRAEYPDTLALDIDTGYDYDYSFYDGNVGFFEHYWNREEIVQPGVQRADDRLPEKASVYGITGSDPDAVWVVSVEDLDADDVVSGTVGGQEVVAFLDATGDVAVYESPPTPVERTADGLVDGEGTEWLVERNALRADGATRDRIAGRHGLWFAFRTHYETAHVLD
ncbi:DUF3179 domain-containing protein [Halomicroarcula sp. F13]|uniref:DUF3179 domain-containing protein n=1 Tax=Haloarcula rubra TaxID=2487747 RepID=A0AAW4PUV4_9EURY|nr:DUF3179 domain-containing (seleno)protein [Halomicroarcula rubra]MBX0325463.1 DUF3179 domain-containing protein [Halomicroarcula rubra]